MTLSFTPENVDKLIKNSYEIDFSLITLTQKKETDPIVYKGPGCISQNKEGGLDLKVYSQPNDLEKELSNIFKPISPGKLISDDNYFTLEATDLRGARWQADNVWVRTNLTIPATGLVVKSKLKYIESVDRGCDSSSKYIFILVGGDYDFPSNVKGGTSLSGLKPTKLSISFNEISLDLQKFDKYITINAESKSDSFSLNTGYLLVEALSILLGVYIKPIIFKCTSSENSHLKFLRNEVDVLNKQFPQPIKINHNQDINKLSSFVSGYIENINEPFSELFGYWHKISRAWQSGIFNASLPLSISIEGIIRKHFEEYGFPEKEIIEHAIEGRKVILGLEINERIRDRAVASIEGLINNPSTKNALHKLANESVIEKELVQKWSKLRNKSAHASEIIDSDNEIQKLVDLTYCCIALFYKLIFYVIQYKNQYIDYSVAGWPESKIQA